VRGINTKAHLAEAEQVMQRRLRDAALLSGVTMIAPETVLSGCRYRVSAKTLQSSPSWYLAQAVIIDDGAVIHAFSHITGAFIGAKAIGRTLRATSARHVSWRWRTGSENFVEIKAATIEAGAKANHLSYIGDSHVGANANIGAGTITCNYDGFDKHRTEIGAGAFVGSNSSLVAPVKIGSGAYIGSGVRRHARCAQRCACGRTKRAGCP